ncbi:MAG TPA: hypothetical protein VJJ51_05235 [Candidatus Methanoperedens sp.]|nr:hypothetical protein [Candidatus Methanoperedens sp.]HLB70429.1 hypothetical protein [Candidatus Methanoperedens sp.]
MVRLEKQGDSFVMITGTGQKQDISALINAISELQKTPPDKNKLKDGLVYLDSSEGIDIRKEIKKELLKAIENEA